MRLVKTDDTMKGGWVVLFQDPNNFLACNTAIYEDYEGAAAVAREGTSGKIGRKVFIAQITTELRCVSSVVEVE
jgi:hypothetical protein